MMKLNDIGIYYILNVVRGVPLSQPRIEIMLLDAQGYGNDVRQQ